MVIKVKGGKNPSINDLRALPGVLDSDAALMAKLIIMEPLGVTKARNFHEFMAEAGDMEVTDVNYARMQLPSVEDILEGKKFNTPGGVWRNRNFYETDLGVNITAGQALPNPKRP